MALQQRRAARSRRSAVAVATASAVASVVLASVPGLAVASPDPMPSVTPPRTPAVTPSQAPAVTPPQTSAVTPSQAPAVTPSQTPGAMPSHAPSAMASPEAAPTPAKPAPALTPAPAFGAYLDYGAPGVARIAQLSAWLGGAELRVGHTYLPGDRWRNIEGPPGYLDVWAGWRREKADRMLVLNVPMLERNEEGVSDPEVRELLQRGAAGEFDQHFRALAERLVALRVPDTVIVLGWEMNGDTYTHRCGPDPQAWKAYWNRIVTTMRAVPGQRFRFDFTPTRGKDAVPWTECYPGDDTVDIIGMDSYDQPSGLTFDEQVGEPFGLQAHVDFAKAHGKPVSYPEWGLFRNGDNPEYMRRMLGWMEEHKPLYNTLTDYCPHGVWQCSGNPRASEVYRALLSGRTDERMPQPTAPASSVQPTGPTPHPAPATSAGCSPLNLGRWVESWLGRKLCLRFDRWSRGR
ncbi:glycosyl hydrolase [Streptomyces sp. NPDC049687]|uniref:glycosyl hydrolase n=1 Tax=Streptomyces sp. NPDC049687 TaxID=3365596 RepID=UPI0037B9B52A